MSSPLSSRYSFVSYNLISNWVHLSARSSLSRSFSLKVYWVFSSLSSLTAKLRPITLNSLIISSFSSLNLTSSLANLSSTNSFRILYLSSRSMRHFSSSSTLSYSTFVSVSLTSSLLRTSLFLRNRWKSWCTWLIVNMRPWLYKA